VSFESKAISTIGVLKKFHGDKKSRPPDTFTVQFAALAKLAGLQGFRFHDLRHAFASLTLADGRSVKEVQLLMGHSSANTTLSVYARAVEGLGREAVTGLARSLLQENPVM
jgi:integrase